MRRRFALVFNAQAGLALPRLLDGVVKDLKAHGGDVFQLAARSAEEATARVREAAELGNCDAVIAAGGDGTFRAVASGVVGTDVPVGLVPLGTGNVLCHEIGQTRTAKKIAATLRDGAVIGARGSLINGAPFFLMAGIGFDARVVANLNYAAKRVLGRAAYTAPVLKAVSEPPAMFDVEVDGRCFEASWVIFTNARRFGGSFKLTGDTQFGADKLVAVVISARTRFQLAEAALALALGRLSHPAQRPAFVTVVEAESATVGYRVSAPVEVDGDPLGLSPVTIESAGPRMQLIVPRAYVADLTNRHTNHVHSGM